MKILIAEDDEDQLSLRGMLLRQSGFETLEASDADCAIGLAATGKPECALIDLRLPTEELGWNLIRGLKALDAAIRIVVFTGLNPGQFARHPEKDLVDEFIVKGSSSAKLIGRIKELAAQERVESQPAGPDRNRP